MVTYTFNVGGIDRAALAEEIINSAARILTLAGFSRDEVSDLFRQAGGQLECEAIDLVSSEDGISDSDGDVGVDRDDLMNRFETFPAAQKLYRLGKRSSVIADLDDPHAIANATKLITEALILRREILDWVRAEAEISSLDVANSRAAWIGTATDDDLDREDTIVFLDDYQFGCDFNWYVISELASALAESGDSSTLGLLAQIILDDELALEERIRQDVQSAVEAAAHFNEFQEFVLSFVGQGELTQAEFLDKFVRAYNFTEGNYVLEQWLEGMMQRGLVERYKRSNRWRISVN